MELISNIFFEKKQTLATIALSLLGAAIGITYLLLPGYAFVIFLAAALILLTGLIKPEYTYYIIILVLVEEMVHFFVKTSLSLEAKFYPYTFPLIVTCLGWMIARAARRLPRRIPTPVDKVLLAIVFFEWLTILWAPDQFFGFLIGIFLLLNYGLFYISGAILTSRRALNIALHVWITAGIITSLGVILSQYIDYTKTINLALGNRVGIQLAFQELVSRPSGFAGVDHAAGFISMSICIAIGLMTYHKSYFVKFIYLILILFLLYGMILTTCRGTIVGLTAAFAFYIFTHPSLKRGFIKYMFIFLFLLISIVLAAKPGFIDRILIGFGYTGQLYFSSTESYSGGAALTSGQGLSGMDLRKYWWKNGLREMEAKPLKLLFGLGMGGFVKYSIGSPEVNSISFAFFYDMGIIGIILFCIFVPILVINFYHYIKYGKRSYYYYIFLASLTAFIADPVIHGLIDYDINSYGSKFFWFPLGFTLAVMNLVKKELEEENAAVGLGPESVEE